MKEKVAERRGRFLVQEMDEEQIEIKCRHYSLLNRKEIQHYLVYNQTEISGNNSLFLLHSSFVLDFSIGKFLNFEEVWQKFSKKLRKETEYMNVMFNYSTVDHYHSHSHTSGISDINNENEEFFAPLVKISEKANTSEGRDREEYSELSHYTVFVMNPQDSDKEDTH
jgi:hypothetical protein